MTNSETLIATARAMVAPGKGILAVDESTKTCTKRFAEAGIESTATSRRDYREMMFRAPGIGEYVSGAILYDETIRQEAADGSRIAGVLKDAGILTGIKVDRGVKPLAGAAGETVTEGLDGLRDRLAEYREIGARFTKWRAVLRVSDELPSRQCIEANAHALGRYAALAQEAGLVPIVEPEVLMDGGHDIQRCRAVTSEVLQTTFEQLSAQRVLLEGIVLKPNMVIAGAGCPGQAASDEIAELTLATLREFVPAEVPGIAFLSGGQTGEEACANLDAMVRRGDLPWELTYSFGRALQYPGLEIWGGSNAAGAQAALLHRARMSSLARSGRYSAAEERAAV
ncbi:MAG: fructose-bisphosphate aldolase class I [Chloroflexi bacterium]|nr:MAG: fructose-bisphosphate aldolase class I [Chloroflexota bacterium]